MTVRDGPESAHIRCKALKCDAETGEPAAGSGLVEAFAGKDQAPHVRWTKPLRVPAYVLIPRNLKRPAPAIVDLHSHGGMFLFGKEKVVDLGRNHPAMTPYHVARSKLFVRERFSKAVLSHLDTAEIEAYIEHTRFPVPEEEQHAPTDDFPGLLRAADLIGQLADINYLRKTAALFNEFRETGISTKLSALRLGASGSELTRQ